MKQFIFLITFLTGCFTGLFSQIVFDHLSDENGLSHNSIRSIVIDDKGFVWLGTFGGVNRYDGYDFKIFRPDANDPNTIAGDDVTCLVHDKAGWLWIGTNSGLSKMNLATNEIKNFYADSIVSGTLSDSKIRSLCLDNEKRLWVGTKEKGLNLKLPESENFIQVPIDQFEYVRAVFMDSRNRLWVGSLFKAVARIDDFSVNQPFETKLYNPRGVDPEKEHSAVYYFYEDQRHIVWVCTNNGLFWYDEINDKFVLLKTDRELPNYLVRNYYRYIIQDYSKDFWVGTWGGLIKCNDLFDLEEGNFEYFYQSNTDRYSLVNNMVMSIAMDTSGVVWIGTENGLEKYDPFKNQFKKLESELLFQLESKQATCFENTGEGELLIGTHTDGLLKYSQGTLKRTSIRDNDITTSLSEDGNIFYLGTWDGKVIEYNNQLDQYSYFYEHKSQNNISTLFRFGKNKIIVGFYNSPAIVYDPESESIESLEKYIPELHSNVFDIIADSNSNIWIATEDGLVLYNELKKSSVSFKALSSERGLKSNAIMDLSEGENGIIWVATKNGLHYYDPAVNSIFELKLGFNEDQLWITDLLYNKGKVWMSLNYNRVASYDVKTREFQVNQVKNGIRSNSYSQKGFFLAKNNTIWLGGESEIFYFNPNDIKISNYLPKPVFTSLRVNNQEVKVNQVINGQVILKRNIYYNKEILLKHRNRDFSISYSFPSHIDQELNQFAFKLEGFHDEWNISGNRYRNIQFTNLKPRSYILKLKAKNSIDTWSEEEHLMIQILPSFWMSYTAYLLYIIIISIIVLIIWRIVTIRTRLKEQILVERVKRERDEKLNNEKIRLFTNISHEFKTPLTLILGPVKQLIEGRISNQELNEKHQLIYSNSMRLLKLVNQVIDFRKAELGELKLKVENTEIVKFTRDLFQSFHPLAEEKNLEYIFETSFDVIKGWIDKDKFEKIMFNLLSNAFKYTEKGRIAVKINAIEGEYRILEACVSDEGIGIPEKKLNKIFTRFYQINDQMKFNTGSGIGLALVKSLIDIHNGEIHVESEHGKGTNFYVKIPISKERYKEDQIFSYQASEPENFNSDVITVVRKTGNNERIVVIEDNVQLRQYLISNLSGDFKTYEAANGEDGLKLTKKVKPHLVVSDIMMEKMDGLEFCKTLKNDSEISHIPVILLTALSETDSRKEGYKTGADDYIIKPFDPSLLKIRIVNIIENRKRLKEKFQIDLDSGVDTISHSKADEEFLIKLKEYIETNMDNPELNISMLCQEFSFSSSKLYKKIKELTDVSPVDFIRTIRLKKSVQLLKAGDLNVSEVAFMVGFNDPLYFSRCFTKQFNMAPSKLLKSNHSPDQD